VRRRGDAGFELKPHRLEPVRVEFVVPAGRPDPKTFRINTPRARARPAHYPRGEPSAGQDKNAAPGFTVVSEEWERLQELYMRFAAKTRIQHLIARGRQVKVVKNDVRGRWNGAKKVMSCFKLERLLSGDNVLETTLCPSTCRILTRVVETTYTTHISAILR
jgi:hypothetical protein